MFFLELKWFLAFSRCQPHSVLEQFLVIFYECNLCIACLFDTSIMKNNCFCLLWFRQIWNKFWNITINYKRFFFKCLSFRPRLDSEDMIIYKLDSIECMISVILFMDKGLKSRPKNFYILTSLYIKLHVCVLCVTC